MAQPEGAPPPKGAVPPPRQVGGGTMWAGCRESGPVAPRAPWNGGVGARPVARRGRARRQSQSDASTHATMKGSAAEKHTRARP